MYRQKCLKLTCKWYFATIMAQKPYFIRNSSFWRFLSPFWPLWEILHFSNLQGHIDAINGNQPFSVKNHLFWSFSSFRVCFWCKGAIWDIQKPFLEDFRPFLGSKVGKTGQKWTKMVKNCNFSVKNGFFVDFVSRKHLLSSLFIMFKRVFYLTTIFSYFTTL